jgi:hypothetical protein
LPVECAGGSLPARPLVEFHNPMPRSWIGYLFRHPRLTFVLMGAFFLLFGLTTVNLFVLLKLNIDLFLDYGLMVVADGALEQFVDLLGSAYLSMLFG